MGNKFQKEEKQHLGSLKNLLDWLVGSGELSGKPVTLFNASARGADAQSLGEISKTMDARFLPDAEITIQLLGKSIDPLEISVIPDCPTLILCLSKRLPAMSERRFGRLGDIELFDLNPEVVVQ